MEELIKIISPFESISPVYFWISGAVVLLLIFIPWFGKKKGLAVDLKYWINKIGFKSKRVMILSIPVFVITLLLAGVMAQPQFTTRPVTNIYGNPVMLVVDVSGSMGVGYSSTTPFGYSYQIFSNLISLRGDINFGLLMFSTDRYIARYFINKDELFKDSLENIKEIAQISARTGISVALDQAYEFVKKHINGGGAIILISDMDTSANEWRKIISQMNQMAMEGIKPYMITPYDAKTIKDTASRQNIDISQVSELKIAAMNDKAGIDEICRDISNMQMSLIRKDEGLEKNSLIPYLIIPALGLIGLCLVLSETRYRKIP